MSQTQSIEADIAARSRLAIMSSGLVQREISRLTGIEESKLSKSLRGNRKFTTLEIIQLATVTGVTASWLMTGSDSGPSSSAAPDEDLLPSRLEGNDRHAMRRRTLVESAWWLFAEHGFDSVRISDIARRCSLSTPTVHYYFASKQELFAEVLRYSIKLAYDRQVAELEGMTHPVQRLKRLVELQLPQGELRVAEWSIWLQTWVKLAVGETGLSTHTPGYQRWGKTVRDTILAGQESGHIVKQDPEMLTTELTALIDGMGIKVMTGLLSATAMYEHICRYIDRNLTTKQGEGS
ncbi:TetR family transcriptional regulator C-terminal domain-containing protein [Glutamicibacter uratoxydans]|nr:TetR family transcriptional regulator C-terminal domain-containing protein [Glutamicibacter uratoxydans]